MVSRMLLTDAEEQVIVNHIISAQGRRLPVTKDTIMSLVSSLLSDKRNLQDKNWEKPYKFGKSDTFMPGESWYRLFLKRHPDIVTRMRESLTGPSRNVSQQDVKQWFADVRSYLAENDFLDILYEAKRNFNIHKSEFEFFTKQSKMLDENGFKPIQNEDNEMDRVTVLANTGADGSHPPPLIIYPNLRVPARVYDSLPTTLAAIGKSESGQMNNDLLYEYLCGGFDEWLTNNNIQRPVIVWADRHEPRMQYHLVKRLAELQIILILIPPNTSHFMQPIEVGVLTPMKKAWKKCVKDFQTSHPNECVTEENFARLFLPMYASVMCKDQIKNAFKICGIHPFDVEAPDYSKLSLKEKHSSDTDSFEVMEQNGTVERGTQMIPVLKLNVASQTRSTQSCESNRPLIYSMKEVAMQALGVQKQIISKGCDDAVLCNPRFEALLYNKRENWFQFVLESDLNSIGSRPRTEAIIDLPKESEPTTRRTANIVKESLGEPIDLNCKDCSFSYSVKTQDNLAIKRDQDDEIERGGEELLEPTTEMDLDDTRDQVGEVVYMELFDPLPEREDDLPDVKDEIIDEELLANSPEIDDDADEEWESLKHSYPPKSSKSNVGMLQTQIENDMENHSKSIHLNWKEPLVLLTSSELNLKNPPGSALKDKLRRTFRENMYPFLKKSFVSVERLPRGLTATEVTKYETANKVKKEKDIDIVDKPNDLNCKEDPPLSCEPKLEAASKFTNDIKEQIETISRSTRKGLESQYSINHSFSRNSDLLLYIKSVHEKRRPFKCLECKHSFTKNGNLLHHIKSVHDKIKPFKCLECKYSFSLKSRLLRHIKSVHKKIKPFKCLECNHSFTDKGNLLQHIKSVHEKIKPFKCSECNNSFSQKGSLVIHMKSVHEKIKRFKCLDCNYSCNKKGNLVRHTKSVHEKIKPFKCLECNYSCYIKENFGKHLISVHDKIKSFKCLECNHSFTLKDHLLQHIKSVHGKIKQFKCSECNNSFTQKGSLVKHIKSVHEKIKRFKCLECNNSFTQKGSLVTHMKSVHEKIKPYKCSECNYSSSRKPDLFRHIKSVHEK